VLTKDGPRLRFLMTMRDLWKEKGAKGTARASRPLDSNTKR